MFTRAHKPSLVSVLLPEAFQSEESAVTHCAREAERYASAPPGIAMRAVSAHAARTLRELRELAEGRGEKDAYAGIAAGLGLSNLRSYAVDLLLSAEKSYRGTLLGVRHGMSTFLLLEDAAVAGGDQRLADFCRAWLAERTALVEGVERDLAWFAVHPDVALARAKPAFVAKLTRRFEAMRGSGTPAGT
jgi:hypothetical protein